MRRCVRCDTFMSTIPRRSNSRRVAKTGERERRDRVGCIRGKNLPIISIVTVRSTFISRHEKPFSSTLASWYCEFIYVKGIRSSGKERRVRKYDILLQRERPFECPREMYEIKFSSARKKSGEKQTRCHETIILRNKMLEEYRVSR